VAIWSKKDLTVSPLDLSQFCVEKVIEVCGAIWHINNTKIIIVTCYRSPSGNFDTFLRAISSMLDSIFDVRYQMIVTGDFNVHFQNNDAHATQLNNTFLTFNMFGIVKQPTRRTPILDNIFTNSNDIFYDVLVCNYSDHQYVIFNDKRKKANNHKDKNSFKCTFQMYYSK
jgi:exonuclease III